MRFHPLAIALLTLGSLGSFTAAHADTIDTFSLNAVADGSLPITGTLTFDATTQTFIDSNLSTAGGPITGAPSASGVTFEETTYMDFGTSTSVQLYFPYESFGLGFFYTGGPLCSASNRNSNTCRGFSSEFITAGESYPFASGNLTLISTAVTPEPSSLALMATGAAALFAFARRRFILS